MPNTLRTLARILPGMLLAGTLLLGAGCSSAADTPELEASDGFSATMFSTTPDGVTSEALIHVVDDAYRLEVIGGRRASTSIVRYDLDVVWLLVPEDRTYVPLGLEELKEDMPHFFSPDVVIERDEGTAETLDEGEAIRYEVTTSGAGGDHTGTLWESVEMPGRPLKWVDAVYGLEIVWQDVSAGPLDPELFELPADYTEFELPEQ